MPQKITPFGYLLITIFFILLAYSAWISYVSIDWDVLKRMESSPLSLPTQISPTVSTPSALPTTQK